MKGTIFFLRWGERRAKELSRSVTVGDWELVEKKIKLVRESVMDDTIGL